ncbi:MAG TPA: fatty acid desaturase [Steroidobacteraceae bacterium]|nr:fatty acid desaturase [Steroidobacteraceae bacterium]
MNTDAREPTLTVPTAAWDKSRGTVRPARALIEMPTLLLIVGVYGGWLTLTYHYGRWPLWIVAPLTAVLLTLHSSVQHEVVHGHPTPWRALNRLFGMVPLSLWLPFDRYRRNHLVHHNNERLTDPLDDPESYYLTPEHWSHLSPLVRTILQVQQTLAGRILIGSFWRIARFLRGEIRAVVRNDEGKRAIWFEHLLWCLPVLTWLAFICRMPLWIYVVTMVIPGNGLLLIRSFAEHRARPDVPERTAIVEGSWIFGPLFLFNNLHAMHHEEPAMPWYEYNARYRLIRQRLITENAGLVYTTYFDVARRFLFRPHDGLRHPTGRVPSAAQAGSS